MDVKAKVFNVNVFFWKYVALLSLLFLSNIVIIIIFFIMIILKIIMTMIRLPEGGLGEHQLEGAAESKHHGLILRSFSSL